MTDLADRSVADQSVADQSLAQVPSPPLAGEEPAIDVAHLREMTLGERSLETQVLELFDRQAEILLARMREVAPAGVATLAHTLCGSARGIGAWRVAVAAQTVECAAAEPGQLAGAMEQLASAVDEARLAIGGLLDPSPTAQ